MFVCYNERKRDFDEIVRWKLSYNDQHSTECNWRWWNRDTWKDEKMINGIRGIRGREREIFRKLEDRK